MRVEAGRECIRIDIGNDANAIVFAEIERAVEGAADDQVDAVGFKRVEPAATIEQRLLVALSDQDDIELQATGLDVRAELGEFDGAEPRIREAGRMDRENVAPRLRCL